MKKLILASSQRIIELFTQIVVSKLSGIRDPGPGKNLPIADPGSRIRVKKALDPGFEFATLLDRGKNPDPLSPDRVAS